MDDIIDNQYHRDCFFDSGNKNWDWQNLSKKSHNNITNEKELSMQIVIDIDDNKLWKIKNEPIKKNFNIYELASYIDKGIPLPKGHGRLIDADELKADCYSIIDPKGIYSELKIIEDYYIDDAPTIIEADKVEKE